MEENMSGKTRSPLIFSVIEDLRRKGYNQSEIAEMHGVTRQAVSWHKKTYGGQLTPRQIVNAAWPWETTNLHGKSKPFQRLRDHGEFMATGGRGMNETKLKLLQSFWAKLRDEDVVSSTRTSRRTQAWLAADSGMYLERSAMTAC
ncbi:immunity repressor [Mycobacterium phage Blinn1]|uniref:Immunity repressor n=2 Tax=Gladiatorvirus TaxID=2948726 RepID=A0A649VSC2_9CAUD|nr:transcriptional repressor [Mycobacterium phage Blinn1]QGJ94842.1 immunity repressor [Mycobacterium phage Blinn1]